jgi:hypothetical protein
MAIAMLVSKYFVRAALRAALTKYFAAVDLTTAVKIVSQGAIAR